MQGLIAAAGPCIPNSCQVGGGSNDRCWKNMGNNYFARTCGGASTLPLVVAELRRIGAALPHNELPQARLQLKIDDVKIQLLDDVHPAVSTVTITVPGATVILEPPVVAASSNYTKMYFPNVAAQSRPGVMLLWTSTGCESCDNSRNGQAPDLYITQDSGASWEPAQPPPGVNPGTGLPYKLRQLADAAVGNFALPGVWNNSAKGAYRVALRGPISIILPGNRSEIWEWLDNVQSGNQVKTVGNGTFIIHDLPLLADGFLSNEGGCEPAVHPDGSMLMAFGAKTGRCASRVLRLHAGTILA